MAETNQLFSEADRTSYSRQWLREWFGSIRSECDKNPKALRTPRGNAVSTYFDKERPCEYDAKWNKAGHTKFKSWEDAAIDWMFLTPDHTDADDPVCPLTLEKPENPYYLTKACRCYELDEIRKAITNTYLIGEPLRLGVCTLNPSRDDIKLIPHYGFGSHDEETIIISPGQVVWPAFNPLRVKDEYPMFTRALGDTPGLPSGGHFQADVVYAAYCEALGIKPGEKEPMMFENIRISGIELFKANHMKTGGNMIVFRNVHFVRCRFKIGCWCGTKFIACRFTECNLDSMGDRPHDLKFVRCDWENPIVSDSVVPGLVTNILSVGGNTLIGEAYPASRRYSSRSYVSDNEDEDDDE